jgi:tetratricopeptide (TPR) repeat protein
MYVELRITDSALFFLNTAVNILKFTNKYADLSKVNAVIADLYLVNNRDYVEAEKYIIEAEKYANKSNNITWVAFAKMKRGILLERLKKYDAALDTLNSALQLYNKIGAIEGRLYAMWIIMDVMVATNNPNSRTYYFEIYFY